MTDSSIGVEDVWGEEAVSEEPSTETVEVVVVEESAPAPAPAEYPIIEIPSTKKKAPAKQPEPEVKPEPVPEVAAAPPVEEPLAPPPEPPSTLAGAADAELAEEEDDLLDDPDPNRRYGIQVASFQTIERARQMAEKVKGSGPVFLVPWNSEKNGDWVRVIVGVYDNKLDGERVLETLRTERWGKDVKLVENRWWQHTPGATGGDVFALADE
jgi:cell division septation protein DedD